MTSLGSIGSGLFWLTGVLSVMTAWMLIRNWRHTRRRAQAQAALVAETNFRRAMENSMATGMRAMDLQGRITYVNAAFCQMTGWSEAELVGRTPPYPIGRTATAKCSPRGWTTNCMAARPRAASTCASSARMAACSMRACMCRAWWMRRATNQVG